jgi:hypothetical protein
MFLSKIYRNTERIADINVFRILGVTFVTTINTVVTLVIIISIMMDLRFSQRRL